MKTQLEYIIVLRSPDPEKVDAFRGALSDILLHVPEGIEVDKIETKSRVVEVATKNVN